MAPLAVLRSFEQILTGIWDLELAAAADQHSQAALTSPHAPLRSGGPETPHEARTSGSDVSSGHDTDDAAVKHQAVVTGQWSASLPLSHAGLPRNVEPTCQIDNLVASFVKECQARAAEGVPVDVLTGPKYPSFTALVMSERAELSHPVSQLVNDLLGRCPDVTVLPDRIASFYLLHLYIRWLIAPTRESYDRLPEWAVPVPSQLQTLHPTWIDLIPWYLSRAPQS